MKAIITLIVSLSLSLHACLQSEKAKQQSKTVGGPCEGCEAANNYGNRHLSWSDTIYGYDNATAKIKISGTVYQSDGKTPASDIILYIYHTDDNGRYPSRPTSTGWERRHGYLRTWLKTDTNGRYEFFTSRPASYPNSTVPQHIHVTVKEPDKNAYYIEDFYFADDPNITSNIINRAKPRGGSGVIQLTTKTDDLRTGTRDIILGLHIPNY